MQRLILICLFLSVFLNTAHITVYGQPASDPVAKTTQPNDSAEKGTGSRVWGEKALDRSQSYKNIKYNLRFPVLTKRDKEQIFPLAEDAMKYQGFLATEGTGLIRVHDISKCTSDTRVVNVSEPCPSAAVPGKGTAFSFRTGGYEFLRLADVQLSSGVLRTSGLNIMVALTAVTDADLEKLSLSSPEVNRLATFDPSIKLEEVNTQLRSFNRGVRDDGVLVRSYQKMELNSNYAIRVVAYKNKVYNLFQGRKYQLQLGGKRDDVLAVFRVVRLHDDGSMTILWKELRRKPGLTFIDDNKK